MSQKSTDQLYQFYRNLPIVAPSLASLFQKVDQSPNSPRSHFELGEAAYQAGLLQLSVECFSNVTKLAPHVEAGFFNLGNVFFDLREFNKAKQAYEQAFSRNPDSGTLNNLGNSYAEMQDWRNASLTFERALSLPGSSPEQVRKSRSNLGKALLAAANWDGALENYRQAILQFPNEIEFLALKANCHHQKFEFGKAIECLVEALAASPNNPELLCQIANVNFCRGRTIEALLCMNQAFSILSPPANLQSRRLQMLAFCAPATPEQMRNEASDWATALNHSSKKSIPKLAIADGEKIASSSNSPRQVGILCQSLPIRGLNDWLPDCLGQCDAARVQWTLFCDSSVDSETRAALARTGCQLEETSRLSDDDLISLIQNHKIALLIDMIGHGLSTRLQVIARKPAPIQITWCAFPMMSGLTEMDFIWSDQVAIPPESEKHFSERVIRFPESSFCFQPYRPINLQTQHKSSKSPFLCVFLGQPEQISAPLIEAMRSILVCIPDAEIVFNGIAYRDTAFQSEIRERFENMKEMPSRVRFESFESAEDELNSYQQFDVTLDPFLVSSPQRSFEALWMGVPVVTLLDERLSSRSTASILNSLHRRDWIATSQSEYVNAVKQLADGRSIWRTKRALIRDELLASPMCDSSLIARSIESAIDETLRQFHFATKPR